MIKFVATDLDGTLLDEQGALPQEIFPLVARLSECGILFAPASGRQYANLKKLFFPVREQLLFICENGALVRRGDETLYLAPIPAPLVKDALDAVRSAGGLFPILCGADTAYVENADEPFFGRARAAYTNCVKVACLDECIAREPVCKISVFDSLGAKGHAMKSLPPLLHDVRLTLSGEYWCDVAAENADKGEAVRQIQRRLGFSPDECMAFGDQMNDAGMLRACVHSRAVENAYPPVKELAARIVPSNAEHGVIAALDELLKKRKAFL